MINLYKLTNYSTKIFQTALNDYGAKPKLKVDGIPGPKTLKAFVDFQFAHNISWTDDLTTSLETLGLSATVKPNYIALKKAKRNVKVEKDRPDLEEIVPEEPPKTSKRNPKKSKIKIPTKRSECFKNLKWIPGATKGPSVNVKSSPYATPQKYFLGVVPHFTAGWNRPGDAFNSLSRTPFAFHCIDVTGEYVQPKNMPLDKWGSHAGESKAVLIGYGKTSSCSNKMLGVEMNCGGLLSKGKKSKGQDPNKQYTWFGKEVPKENRRYLSKTTEDWGPKGWYEKLSVEQEEVFIDMAVFACLNNPACKWQNTFTHHEIAGMKFLGKWRKNDVGGSFSMPPSKIRAEIGRRVEKVLAS